MSADPWGILDLPPGSPTAEIRRAYARKLKQIDADSDPQGFQTLREAYEAALQGGRGRDTSAFAASPQAPAAGEPDPDFDLEAFMEFEKTWVDPDGEVIDALRQRIHGAEDLPNDALRLMQVLSHPKMIEPRIATMVEREIFSFLLARINWGEGQRPSFRLGFAAPPCLRAARHEARDLMAELDRRFGWFSDAVRMREQRGYQGLLLAAQDLQPSPQPVQTKVGVKVKALVIGLFILAGVTRATLNILDRPPDPRQVAQAQIELLTQVREASAADIAQDRDWLADPAKGEPTLTTRKLLELSLGPDLPRPPNVSAGRRTLDKLRAGQVEGLTWTDSFLAGSLFGHAYVLDHDMGYRQDTPFRMATAEGQTLWTNAGADSRLWPGGAGYVVSLKAPEVGDVVALYPADYVDALRGLAKGNIGIWQGALLVPPEVVQKGSRLYRIAAPDFPPADEVKISNSWSVLPKDAMVQNRWPIRAITLTEVPCAALEWGEAGFEPLSGCP